MPSKPDDSAVMIQNAAWYRAVLAVTSAAQQALDGHTVVGDRVLAPALLLVDSINDKITDHTFRLSTTKLLWQAWRMLRVTPDLTVADEVPADTLKALAPAIAGAGMGVAGVFSSLCRNSDDLALFVKAMSYPDGMPPELKDIVVVAVIVLHRALLLHVPGDNPTATAARLAMMSRLAATVGV